MFGKQRFRAIGILKSVPIYRVVPISYSTITRRDVLTRLSFVYRFDPLLHDGCTGSDETRAGGLPTGQAGALSVRIVQGDHKVLGCRPFEAAHVRRSETRAGRAFGEPRVRRQLRGPGEPRRRVGRQRERPTVAADSNRIKPDYGPR